MKVGLLTSGGDCPGLNAAICSVIRSAHAHNIEIIGICNSTQGLSSGAPDLKPLPLSAYYENPFLFHRGGTLLGSTTKKTPPISDNLNEIMDTIVRTTSSLEFDALIFIGGDGSLRMAHELSQRGLRIIAIPKTIDQDIPHTHAIGFSTAVSIATDALEKLQTTAISHERLMILEVMGKHTGHIALSAGVAAGADHILIPEKPYCLHTLAKTLTAQLNHKHALVVISEAAHAQNMPPHIVKDRTKIRYQGSAEHLAAALREHMKEDIRTTTLGHLQRGGPPNAHDKLLASILGNHAVSLLVQGIFNRLVTWSHDTVGDIPLKEVAYICNTIKEDDPLLTTAYALGIKFGVS